MKIARFLSIAAIGLICSSAYAGGLFLNEFGTPSMGTAGAGAQAWADDASTAFHNPAGMTRVKGSELMLTGGLFHSNVEFDVDASVVPGGDGGDAGGWAPLVGLFYTKTLSEKWSFGFDVIALSGAALDYDDDWAGRWMCQDVSIMTVAFNPSLAYEVTDDLSVAAGFAAIYGVFDLDIGIPGEPDPLPGPGTAELDGEDWQYAYNFGVMYELSERTRIGAVYWSEVEFEFDGDLKVSPAGIDIGSDLELPLPQWIKAGVYHELNDKWALVGTVGWEDWSTMDDLALSTEAGGTDIPRNWRDTYHYAGGIHYRPSEKWLLQTGVAYDTNPVDADDRTADMPIDRQVRYAVGVQYKYSETLTLGGAFEYIDLGSAKITKPLFRGEYEDNEIFAVGVYARWKY